MKIEKKRLREAVDQNSLVVVIDVLRAFTTAAFAFGGGAKSIFVTSTIDEALALHGECKGSFLVGEENGIAIKGFHFNNSPAQMASAQLKGATLIHRTTCGTQGLLLSNRAQKVLAASFVVAEATYRRICELAPSHVTFLITGHDDADEDAALADYLELKLNGESPEVEPFLKRVQNSSLGQKFSSRIDSRLVEDLELALEADRFSFSMELLGQNMLGPVYF